MLRCVNFGRKSKHKKKIREFMYSMYFKDMSLDISSCILKIYLLFYSLIIYTFWRFFVAFYDGKLHGVLTLIYKERNGWGSIFIFSILDTIFDLEIFEFFWLHWVGQASFDKQFECMGVQNFKLIKILESI